MSQLSRQCAILVGGLGTRLGSITSDCPKPLLEVGGQPFLGHLVANARRFGFTKFVLLAGFRADLVRQFAKSFGDSLNVEINVSEEPSPAGTAGALLAAEQLLENEFLLLNGDSIFDFNLLDLATHPSSQQWIGRLALRRVADTGRYGRVELSGDRITSLEEKSACTSEGLINGGVYWLRKSILDIVNVAPMSIEREVFPTLSAKGLLQGVEYDGPFIDIGIPNDLSLARSNLLEMLRRPAVFFDRDGVLNEDPGYTHKAEEFRWIEGAKEAIKRANDKKRYVFVVTNQAGIARGYYTADAVNSLHAWMNDELRGLGAHIDDFRFCPHHPSGQIVELSRSCDCRKPKPGMLNSLLSAWPVDRDASILIGDKDSDMEAAEAAGIRSVQFNGKNFSDAI